MINRMVGVMSEQQVIEYLCDYISILRSENFEQRELIRDLKAQIKFSKNTVEEKETKHGES